MSAMRHQTVVVVVGKHMTLDDGCAAGFPEKPLPSFGSMDQFFGYDSDFGPIVSMRGHHYMNIKGYEGKEISKLLHWYCDTMT